MIRGDLSNRLVHLTKGATPQDAASAFVSILRDARLRGSSGHIRGGFNCVCFSEAPLGTLTHVLALPGPGGMRYAPFGVMVSKKWLFRQGGRPVIYQAHDEYDLLHESQRFRHVRYEPDRDVDHTWEREWRIQTDGFALDPAETTFVVPTRAWERRFHAEHAEEAGMLAYGFDLPIVEPIPWHFVVLEDLGVEGIEDHF